MDKKDIYEHLAKIYLDASINSKKQAKKSSVFKSPIFIGGSVALAAVILFMGSIFREYKIPKNAQIALIISNEPIKINFNFNPAKKEICTISLNNLNMLKFKALEFSVRKTGVFNNINLRVEFTNIYNERSEAYFRNIPGRWQTYQVKLDDFKNIADWSCMRTISFVVEEWNVKEKNGVVYIDNVKFLR
ncbi:MAG: hypothetical protein NT033_05005 [Candidatus Omnitrophica bacterium]|nr:hypothetical protein [Candidatus Omnitrophota bacterium]